VHVLAIACVANWAACIRSGHRRDEHGITLTSAWALTDPTPLPTDGSAIDAIGGMTLSFLAQIWLTGQRTLRSATYDIKETFVLADRIANPEAPGDSWRLICATTCRIRSTAVQRCFRSGGMGHRGEAPRWYCHQLSAQRRGSRI
jgi:hypothetical protein